jgi:putative protease
LLIEVSGPGGTKTGFSLNNAPVARGNGIITMIIPEPVVAGASVNITSSRALDARARQIVSHPGTGLQHPVPIDLTVQVNHTGDVTLEGKIPAGFREVTVTRRFESLFSPARSRPLARDQLESQLKKTGGTQFVIRNFALTYRGDMFAPVAAINGVRREFLKAIEEAMVSSFRPAVPAIEGASRKWKKQLPGIMQIPAISGACATPLPHESLRLAVSTDTIDGVKAALAAGCESIWFEPGFSGQGDCPDGEILNAYEKEILASLGICRDAGVRLIWKLHRITSDREIAAIMKDLPTLISRGLTGCLVENIGVASDLSRSFPSLELSGSTGLNIFNHRSANSVPEQFRLLTPSPELSREDLHALVHVANVKGNKPDFAIIVQGLAEAMITEDCLLQPVLRCTGDGPTKGLKTFYGIRDATGHVFPVIRDGACRTHVLNAVEICLVDHLMDIMRIGIREIVIDSRGRTPEYASSMTRIYRTAISSVASDPEKAKKTLAGCKEAIAKVAYGGLTSGHFIRGLKEEI